MLSSAAPSHALVHAPSEAFKTEADEKIEALAAKQEAFGALSLAEKAQLLDEILGALRGAEGDLPQLGSLAAVAQGHESGDGADADLPWCFEQLLLVQWVTEFCNKFKATLQGAETGNFPAVKDRQGAPVPPRKVNDQEVVDVYPLDSGDTMKPTKNWKVELWMQKGKGATQGAMFSKKPRPNSVGLVLGAGNVGALAIMDCLHLLFQANTVVLYKLHPIRSYQDGFARKLFEPLISKGFFETITEGQVADAQYLTSHPSLCQIHMTGSTETHDAIVWGPKEGRDARRASFSPVLDLSKVTVTSELGCVTPYIVCPGDWSDEDLAHHALHLAVAMTGNNGYYCNSPKVLVLAGCWQQKEKFVAILSKILQGLPPIPPYYPGSHKRYEGFMAAYGERSDTQKIKGPGFGSPTRFGEQIPWTLIRVPVDAANLEASSNEYAFKNEPFCPILTICTIDNVSNLEQYLTAATSLCNKHIWGRLSCSMIVPPYPSKQEDSRKRGYTAPGTETKESCSEKVEKAISELEYGLICVNAWSGLGYGFITGAWGAYAGGEPAMERVECVESGLGFVNNALAYDHIEKCVARCPFIDKDTQVGTGKKMTRDTMAGITGFLITPGFKSFLKMLFPRSLKCL